MSRSITVPPETTAISRRSSPVVPRTMPGVIARVAEARAAIPESAPDAAPADAVDTGTLRVMYGLLPDVWERLGRPTHRDLRAFVSAFLVALEACPRFDAREQVERATMHATRAHDRAMGFLELAEMWRGASTRARLVLERQLSEVFREPNRRAMDPDVHWIRDACNLLREADQRYYAQMANARRRLTPWRHDRPRGATKRAAVLAVLEKHPTWTQQEIAEEAGCSQAYAWKLIREAGKPGQAVRRRQPRGRS